MMYDGEKIMDFKYQLAHSSCWDCLLALGLTQNFKTIAVSLDKGEGSGKADCRVEERSRVIVKPHPSTNAGNRIMSA